MRVLHVTESMGAGVYTAIGQYVAPDEASDPDGITHHVLARIREDSFVREAWLDSVPHVLAPTLPTFVRGWLAQRKEPFDVVHAHSTVAGQLTRLLPHPTARTVYSPHGLAAVHHRRRAVRSVLTVSERALARRTSAAAAVGASEEAELRDLVGTVPVVRLPHALRLAQEVVPRTARTATICAVGRLTYQKAPDTVADLPVRLAEAGLDARCVWVGDGDPELAALLGRHGWEVTGWVGRDEVDRRVAAATALLHPARYEGLSLAVAEALAQGTPVVARRIVSNLEFGGVRTFDTSDEAADLLVELLTDADAWAALSAAGLAYVARAHAKQAQTLSLHRLYEHRRTS